MSKFNNDDEIRLLELLTEQLELFRQVKEQTIKQTQLMEADDIEAFSISLDSRESLIEKINGLHQESNILMQSYISKPATGDYGKTKEIEELRNSIKNIITECQEMNINNTKSAQNKKDEYTKRINELDKSKKTFNAYSLDIPDNSEHFDRTT